MFRLKHLSLSISCLLALGLTSTSSQAQDSTDIRLGNTDFGGQGSQKLSTSNASDAHHKQSRSFRNSASDPHIYKHRDDNSSRYSRRPQQSYGNDADDPHYYKNRDRSADNVSSDNDKDKQHYHNYRQPSYGIQGHRSFGLSPGPHYHNKEQDYNQRQYRDYDRHHQSYSYPHKDPRGLSIYTAPISYSAYESQSSSTSIFAYKNDTQRINNNTGMSQSDAWDALGDYDFDTARYAFESLLQQQPESALPRAGYAFSTALSGDLQTGAYAMEEALLYDVSELGYFKANNDLQLIFEELLLSYRDNPLMTASLHYFMQDYQSANKAVNIAADGCQQCPAVINLERLIKPHI
ncbi:hypothetical protein [Methylophaga sp.]|uniref:hypothetical protein n=1 Tax=Methylophaga sp. TaxID=2024840 RepID=UPI003F696845